MNIINAGEGPVIELPDDPQTTGGFNNFLIDAGGHAAQQDAPNGWATMDCRPVVVVQAGILQPELADRRVTLWTAYRPGHAGENCCGTLCRAAAAVFQMIACHHQSASNTTECRRPGAAGSSGVRSTRPASFHFIRALPAFPRGRLSVRGCGRSGPGSLC